MLDQGNWGKLPITLSDVVDFIKGHFLEMKKPIDFLRFDRGTLKLLKSFNWKKGLIE